MKITAISVAALLTATSASAMDFPVAGQTISIGANTDIKGFELAMNDTGFDVSQKSILILGAGGVVPSIIFALKRMQASEITVSNTTKTNAEGLKDMFGDLKISLCLSSSLISIGSMKVYKVSAFSSHSAKIAAAI